MLWYYGKASRLLSAAEMQSTPHKTSQKIDEVIFKLNGRWNLQLPRLHGLEATKAGDSTELAQKCSSRIRALCWNGNVNIDGILEDFNERASQRHSSWICKCSDKLDMWKGSRQRLTQLSLSRQTFTASWYFDITANYKVFPEERRYL